MKAETSYRGAMTIRTGKSERYRYYICSIAARQFTPERQ